MDEDQKLEIAVFRFGVIHDLVGGVRLLPGEKERLIREKCERKWSIPYSTKTRVARTTIRRWARMYQDSGGRIESLYPKGRSDRGKSRSLDGETGLSLLELRKRLPEVTIPTLIEKMENQGLVSPEVRLTTPTVYRFLHAHGLMRRPANRPLTALPPASSASGPRPKTCWITSAKPSGEEWPRTGPSALTAGFMKHRWT